MNNLNNIELNAVLFYADVLSLEDISIPVTDNCKYFYIHNTPINILSIAGNPILIDSNNCYYREAVETYLLLRDKYGEDGVQTFIDKICAIGVCGMVDAERILKCIHQYDDKSVKKAAYKKYQDWVDNKHYTTTIIDDDGDPQQIECSAEIWHYTQKYKVGCK